MDDITRRQLMDAGAAAIRFNAPLGPGRVDTIADFVGSSARTVLDVGCGAGALLIDLAERFPELQATGIDRDPSVIERAAVAASGSIARDRLRFEVADAADLDREVAADVVLCIGSTHAFGGAGAALTALAGLATRAVVADGVWAGDPTDQHHEWFGELPDGEDGLATLAIEAGWAVAERDRSTLAEWDGFEHGWIRGVRSVGTPEAEGFAGTRLQEYEGPRGYRGVLGFGWLLLVRDSRTQPPVGAG